MLSAIFMFIILVQSVYATAAIGNALSLNKTTTSTATVDEKKGNLVSNADFMLYNNKSGLPLYWNDSSKGCGSSFECSVNLTSGWKDNKSFQISTKVNSKDSWLGIYGNSIDVNPNERYKLVFHMKLNKYATGSTVLVQGSNKTWPWTQNMYCPTIYNGSLEWREFSCEIRIPQNTTIIAPILAAGWSSQQNKEAVTWYDGIYITKLTGKSAISNATSPPTKASTTDGDPSLTNVTTQSNKPTIGSGLCSILLLQC
jgi:hypothetical protein